MKTLLIIALAAITYASRVIGFTISPPSQGRVQTVLERLPAPLFAALAVVALVDDAGTLSSTTSLLASGFALAATPTRSLPLIFAAGVAGYVVAVLVGLWF